MIYILFYLFMYLCIYLFIYWNRTIIIYELFVICMIYRLYTTYDLHDIWCTYIYIWYMYVYIYIYNSNWWLQRPQLICIAYIQVSPMDPQVTFALFGGKETEPVPGRSGAVCLKTNGRRVGKSWGNHRKDMKSWENHGEIIGKIW